MSDSHSAVLMRAMRARRAPAREGGGEGEGGGGAAARTHQSARSCCSRAPARRSK